MAPSKIAPGKKSQTPAPQEDDSQKVEKHYGLCYRCQHRVDFFETQRQPRCECGDTQHAVHSCYMFLPTLPVALVASDPKDPRPILGPAMIAGRVCIAGPVPPVEYYMVAKRVSNGLAVVPDLLGVAPAPKAKQGRRA